MLDAIQRHPHARAVLGAALRADGHPSHAYLFHGPPGAGKADAARAFAAELLADAAADPDAVRRRVLDQVHPDLTWVRPSGAAEMLISDIDEPVVAAATRTPFEATRRVFVIESAERMNDGAANRLLKTLEEPASFVHVLLLSARFEDVLGTIRSRCQQVRFEAAPAAQIAQRLIDLDGVDPAAADAAARLALGDASCARDLVQADGALLRDAVQGYVRAALAGELAERPWEAVLEIARRRGADAAATETERAEAEAEMLPERERRRRVREAETAARRVQRRAATQTIDLALRLSSLWLRDLVCTLDGVPDVICHSDRRGVLDGDLATLTAAGATDLPTRLRDAASDVEETRTMLQFHPSEEPLLEALAQRVGRTVAPR